MKNNPQTDVSYEEPRSETGKLCEWIAEEIYDLNGELENWDLYCANCFRYRDFSKEEFIDDNIKNT